MKIQYRIAYAMAICTGLLMLLFVAAVNWIGFDVKNQCEEARAQYGGECIAALSRTVEDGNQSFKRRNDAVWALGQLGDRRALPVLLRNYTGIIPDREPYNSVLSQYELKKAINLSKGGMNIGAFFWRYGIQ